MTVDVGRGIAGLRRVAFLLERELAPTYRVKAFRGAAATLAELPEDAVAQRAERGTLTDLAGIGPKTSTVFEECARGGVPAYLAELESHRGPDAGDGAALLATLRGDLHVHSDWSDGGSPIEVMAATAAQLGRSYTALTDHSPRLTVARGLSPERLRRQLDVVARLNSELAPFRLLTGIEALQDARAQAFLLHVGGEGLDDLEVDVRLEEGEADLAHRRVDVGLGHAATAGEPGQGLAEAVAQAVEHAETGTLGTEC